MANRSLIAGNLVGNIVLLTEADGQRSYNSDDPLKFSATKRFPPLGHKSYSGSIENGIMTLLGIDGGKLHLKVSRKSPTLLKKPDLNAVVLFDGTNKEEWIGGRLDQNTTFKHGRKRYPTKRSFNDYKLHLEFLLPYRPSARGQARGNSGLYHLTPTKLKSSIVLGWRVYITSVVAFIQFKIPFSTLAYHHFNGKPMTSNSGMPYPQMEIKLKMHESRCGLTTFLFMMVLKYPKKLADQEMDLKELRAPSNFRVMAIPAVQKYLDCS